MIYFINSYNNVLSRVEKMEKDKNSKTSKVIDLENLNLLLAPKRYSGL
ncbi:hypothetical protein [Campylobacter portucalensis]|nr:hypothetical protein [Campylobacter portucalensis]